MNPSQRHQETSPEELLEAVSASLHAPAPVEPPDAGVLARLFGKKVINDGTGMIKLDATCIVERGVRLALAVEVNWPMILANAVARLYLVADANREPLLAQVLLIPDIVPPHVHINACLDASGYVRAVVECGDGSLLQVTRWIWVMPSEPSALSLDVAGKKS